DRRVPRSRRLARRFGVLESGRQLVAAEVRDARRLCPQPARDPETTELAVELERPAAPDRAVAAAGGQEEAELVLPDRCSLLPREQQGVGRREWGGRRVLERPVVERLEVALPGFGGPEEANVA